MARKCDICGKRPLTGHRVSHAHNLTKRRWYPNVHRMRIVVNGRKMRARVCTDCLKSGKVEKAS